MRITPLWLKIMSPWSTVPTLRDRYSPRANGLGFLRLVLAFTVLVAHSWPLGLGEANLGLGATRGQTDLGALAVDGFFVLSGFLVTGSARRIGPIRFAWHRFLRIFPGLWVCLLVIALVLAPLTALFTRGTLAAVYSGPRGSLQFAWHNWFGAAHQWGIGDLLTETPYGRLVHSSVFNGSLWSLAYELLCYAGLGALIAVGVTRRSPWLVLLLTAAAYLVVVTDFLRDLPSAGLLTTPQPRGGLGPIPLLGFVDQQLACYLGFLFLLGASAQLYQHRIPMHPALAVGAGVALAFSMFVGGFYLVGYPAYAYLLLYAACVLPRFLHRVGRDRDYSYGIYIYAFPTQQLVALVGGARWGVVPYVAMSAAVVLLFAAGSWHLVERPALSLKQLSLRQPSLRLLGFFRALASRRRKSAVAEPAAPEPVGAGRP